MRRCVYFVLLVAMLAVQALTAWADIDPPIGSGGTIPPIVEPVQHRLYFPFAPVSEVLDDGWPQN